MRATRVRRVLRSRLWWVMLALLIVAFLWFVPQLQGQYFSQKVSAAERPALVNEYRRTWAQIIGGFGLFLGIYLTWRRIEISQQELEATRDQQVTERFTRAIDQLGATDDKQNKRMEIRLGGIYALERIAGDSLAMKNSPGRDYRTVMEVLTAYVRENTSKALGPSRGSPYTASTSNEATTAEADEEVEQPAPPELRRPTADIQAILDVLGRTQARVPKEYRARLDLHEATLQKGNLQDANLFQANLFQANLFQANLQDANLRGAALHHANLRYAFFVRANLEEAHLEGANLQDANLEGAVLTNARVTKELLEEVESLQGATMPDGSKHS